MNIGFLGGTFNPPHKAHEILGLAAEKELKLDTLLVCPCRLPVHKKAQNDPGPKARWEMAQAFCAKHARWQPVAWELRHANPSWTSETLRRMQRVFPCARRFLVVGADSFLTLPNWHEVDAIVKIVEVATSTRGYRNLSPAKIESVLNAVQGLRPIFLHTQVPDISSTIVRDRLTSGEEVKDLVPANVLALIEEHSWYR